MAAKNNFKELEKKQLEKFPHSPPEIETNVKGSMRLFQFMGDIVELYLPRVFDLLVSLSGGERAPDDDVEGGDSSDEATSPTGEQKPF